MPKADLAKEQRPVLGGLKTGVDVVEAADDVEDVHEVSVMLPEVFLSRFVSFDNPKTTFFALFWLVTWYDATPALV